MVLERGEYMQKNELYNRIKDLKRWQIELLIFDFLFDANEKQLKNIEKEVEENERINQEIKEEFKDKK